MKKDKKAWQHFDDRASEWTNLYERPIFKDRLGLFVKEVSQSCKKGQRILDYGCGTGVISLKLAKAGYIVKGVDASKEMILQAQKFASPDLQENLVFDTIDPDRVDLGGELYDAIVCSSVIEYVDDDIGLLQMFSKSLKPGGHLIITLPHDASVLAKLEDMIKAIGRKRDVDYCQRRYNTKQLKEKLSGFGLVNYKTKYFEVPKLGWLGVAISRMPIFGLMMMVNVEKK